MPLPMGHTAIGLAAYELSSNNDTTLSRLKIFIFMTILANLPDVDILFGLLVEWNGNAFHRGPTHSLAFALIMGLLASRAWKLSAHIPKMRFEICSLIIFSHVLADFLFTTSPVSFLWPFEVSWCFGHSGWSDVLNSVFFQGFQDAGIIIGSAVLIVLVRLLRNHRHKLLEVKIRYKS